MLFGVQPFLLDCERASTTSFLVSSVGKRITVDAISVDYTLVEGTAVATNLRKFYTLTIGRLSWQWTNLTSAFKASCDDKDNAARCSGLQLPLSKTSVGAADQRLVAGASSTTVTSLTPLNKVLAFGNQRYLPLALVREPPLPQAMPIEKNLGFGVGEMQAGDVLLSHNIKHGNLTTTDDIVSCSAYVEDRINSTLNNHYYNEHGLQPAYTAAVFFLFENAVVCDVIPLDNDGSVTLDFAHNVRHIAVWLSVPSQSVWLTLAGCILLVVGLAAAMLQSETLSKTQSDSLANISTPHVIARVMLDEGQFPPLLLHRCIVTKEASGVHRKVDQFAIDSLGLKDQHTQDRLAAVE